MEWIRCRPQYLCIGAFKQPDLVKYPCGIQLSGYRLSGSETTVTSTEVSCSEHYFLGVSSLMLWFGIDSTLEICQYLKRSYFIFPRLL